MDFKKITQRFKIALAGMGLLSFFIILSLKAPDLHSSYIRSSVGNSVVKVLRSDSGGTGFHVVAPSGQTYIMTNRHVCSDKIGDVLQIQSDSGTNIPRKIVAIYDLHDLCLIEPLPGIKGLKLGSALSVGSPIGIVGHPLLVPLTYMKGTVVGQPMIEIAQAFNITKDECNGRFIDLRGTMYEFFGVSTVCMGIYETQQVDYIAYKGNSGSPAVNFYGNVVGVHFAGRQDSITVGYIVPLKYVRNFLKDY